MSPRTHTPALCASTSSGSARSRSPSARTCARDARSPTTRSTSPERPSTTGRPRSSLRAWTRTRCPWASSVRAATRPMPSVEPVMQIVVMAAQPARRRVEDGAGPGMRRALARARDGKALDLDEATILLGARGDDLEQLCAVAARVRDAGLVDAGRPGVVTYCRKVFVPLTRLCRDRCHYCTFATAPGRLPAPYLSIDEVLDIAREGAALGLQGGAVHPGRPARGALGRGARVARRGGLRRHAGLRAGLRRRGARGDRAAAAPQPRRDDAGPSCSGSSRSRRPWG